MATYLVLNNFVSPLTNIGAGTKIDDASYPNLAALQTAGLSVIPYDGASQDASIAAFGAQFPDNPNASLLSLLTAAGVVTPGAGVPSTRTITAGAGLTGGGSLAANRTLDVVANADGSIVVNANDLQVGVLATDAQHGALGNDTLHTIADATHAGFAPAGSVAATGHATAGKVFSDSPYTAPVTLTTLELDTTAGIIVVNLPTLASAQGQRLTIADVAAFATHKATITPNGSEKINGVAAALDLATTGERIMFVAGATSWWTLKSA